MSLDMEKVELELGKDLEGSFNKDMDISQNPCQVKNFKNGNNLIESRYQISASYLK